VNYALNDSNFEEIALFLCNNFNNAAFFPSATLKGWTYSNVLALGVHDSTENYAGPLDKKVDGLIVANNDWVFGHLAYELHSELEKTNPTKESTDGFSKLFFFVPETIIFKEENNVRIGSISQAQNERLIEVIDRFKIDPPQHEDVELHCTTPIERYARQGEEILRHIHRGDIYEINYCIDFSGYAEHIDASRTFQRLQENADAPFAVLYKKNTSWLMCASPERYIAKNGTRVKSQPIKGTRKRGENSEEDLALIEELQNDVKERMENIMIVDLVRNDLSRIAERGSVEVTELCGIHTFNTVHQMISTVECTVAEDIRFSNVLTATFPMGSMTGAPKISAIRIASELEDQPRGIYSGSVGMISPEGDFDFNVVIRSITWNEENGIVSAKTGSAFTEKAIALKEYEECLLKGENMKNALKRV